MAASAVGREFGCGTGVRRGCLRTSRGYADIGLAELPPYPFACVCRIAGCTATWCGTP